MKKVIVCMIVAMFVFGPISSTADAGGRGGFMGFIAGCCFGPRAAADYNDGKEIHWREWCRVIPYVGLVFAIWDGVDGASGLTRSEWVSKYGSTFY